MVQWRFGITELVEARGHGAQAAAATRPVVRKRSERSCRRVWVIELVFARRGWGRKLSLRHLVTIEDLKRLRQAILELGIRQLRLRAERFEEVRGILRHQDRDHLDLRFAQAVGQGRAGAVRNRGTVQGSEEQQNLVGGQGAKRCDIIGQDQAVSEGGTPMRLRANRARKRPCASASPTVGMMASVTSRSATMRLVKSPMTPLGSGGVCRTAIATAVGGCRM